MGSRGWLFDHHERTIQVERMGARSGNGPIPTIRERSTLVGRGGELVGCGM